MSLRTTPDGPPGVSRFGVTTLLAVGFAAVFALWLVWSYQVISGLDGVAAEVTAIRHAYDRGDEALVRIRTNVLLSSVYLRDAVLEAVPGRRTALRTEFVQLRDDAMAQLAGYEAVALPEDRGGLRQLAAVLDRFWEDRDAAFPSESQTTDEAAAIIRMKMAPSRQDVLDILDHLAAQQALTYAHEQAQVEGLQRQATLRLVLAGSVPLLLAFAAALASGRRISRLQREVEAQRTREEATRQDLERLSARLVDVQEQERRSIARELHDTVGQALTAVKLDIGVALRGTLDTRARGVLEEARDVAERTLQGVRNLSQLLHPSVLDDFGLEATLRAYLTRFSERTSIAATLSCHLSSRLPAPVEAGLYRIAQEALNNVARHSHASACTVSLAITGGLVSMDVEDNGQGRWPAPGARRSNGLGLIAMRERAQSLGGSVTVGAGAAGGTRLTAVVPMAAEGHAA
ncbi:MAG: histidine kinase [Vicinamibacterales bacterium]